MLLHIWPPNPDPESFESDLPNEGLMLCDDDEDGVAGISSCKEECQGHCILTPEDVADLHWVRPSFGCTNDPQYLDAYRVIMEELAVCWGCNYDDTKGHWVVPKWVDIMPKIYDRLKAMGWQDIEDEEDGEGNYWKVKS